MQATATTYQCTINPKYGQSVEISYLDNRNTSANHTLLLLHGLFDHKHTWDLIWPQLTKQFRLVAPDLVGFGYSSKPRFPPSATPYPYSSTMHSDYLAAFIATLTLDNLILVGNSLGGGIALHLLCAGPKITANIDGLVLIDAAGYPQPLPGYINAMAGWMGTLINYSMIRRLAFVLGLINWSVRRTYHRTFYDITKIPEPLYKITMDILRSPDIFYVYQQAARHLVPLEHNTLINKFSQIHQPTLILWGQQDSIIPALFARHFNAAIEHSELHVLNHCGHAPQLEQAVETAHLVNTWTTQNL